MCSTMEGQQSPFVFQFQWPVLGAGQIIDVTTYLISFTVPNVGTKLILSQIYSFLN